MVEQYSLWWMPNPDTEAFNASQQLIDELADKYNTPKFDTHITLIANRPGTEAEIIQATEQLASKIKPFKVTLGRTRTTDNLYQSLVAIAAGEELEDAAYIARDHWKDNKATVYRPHLSLLYTENHDPDFKNQLLTEVGDRFKGMTFQADRIHIFTSVPGIEGISQWKRVAEVLLTGKE